MKKILITLSVFATILAACGGGGDSNTNVPASYTPPGANTAKELDGEKLIAKSDCIGCHNKERKVIGPSYLDIAAKYEATEENTLTLANRIINGSKGIWGPVPMTPHAKLSQEEAKEMAKYILSLKK